MNYGFVINNRKCIGCHACSTACKSENEVPLGVNRTWVKSVEVGLFPDVKRSFQVTRCNHCANPPCVRICPTGAMYQRDDGIVEFESDSCIGCKACMQACPYDAIHIDPNTQTAAKCHFCSHRTEIGLEPACVVVCPEHAIIAGDLDDPLSEISRVLASEPVTVRKPEQGTAPKLFYIGGHDAVMHPTAAESAPKSFAFSEVVSEQGRAQHHEPTQVRYTHRSGQVARQPAAQGIPERPIMVGAGRMAEQMVQVHYNAQHEVPWHWPVPAYLVTKAIGTGTFGFLALGALTGMFAADTQALLWGGGLGILATLATTALLVYDLEKPERFLYILLRPQWKSWLTRGAFILIAFSTISGLWWLSAALGMLSATAATAFALVTLPLAGAGATYTAFLFAQAEGRDLWQSPALPMHLLVQALMMGSGSFLLLAWAAPADLYAAAAVTFAATVCIDLFMMVFGEVGVPHASEVAARAAHEIRSGKYRTMFWRDAVLIGRIAPLALLAIGWAPLSALAFLLAVFGLYAYEYAFVMAPQEVPNS
ncbi:MAG: Fe-S-cluster-containing dehydrogenase component [Myxococcota bacterium]|jgi:Fe-S-cluster-containing dehydrogenase component/formate-dependent nitrite reductase membrane component NrfD